MYRECHWHAFVAQINEQTHFQEKTYLTHSTRLKYLRRSFRKRYDAHLLYHLLQVPALKRNLASWVFPISCFKNDVEHKYNQSHINICPQTAICGVAVIRCMLRMRTGSEIENVLNLSYYIQTRAAEPEGFAQASKSQRTALAYGQYMNELLEYGLFLAYR